MKHNVLILEDEKSSLKLLEHILKEPSYNVVAAMSCEQARLAVRKNRPDLAIFDINLPDGSGLDLLEELRASEYHFPVIMVSARFQIDDKLRAFALGAEDYVVKPYDPKELRARIELVVKRNVRRHREEKSSMVCGEYMFDTLSTVLHYRGTSLQLKPKEFAVLKYLAMHAGKTVSSAVLYKEVWNLDFDPGTKMLAATMSRLRKSLKERFGTSPIHTIIDQGYRFTP